MKNCHFEMKQKYYLSFLTKESNNWIKVEKEFNSYMELMDHVNNNMNISKIRVETISSLVQELELNN
ncbi:hypothetical protein [Arsenophonus sp.]|uniref:hypothetical protein n=1 Tax=Arsenophonus sp. TaxID=1872640 RepID=UPI002854BB16|nr:hypothetical protein [Arsenophonus sp.]MDR5609289.1 hypothetical protein [Arsenophonus sp.]MDR5613021.1 hypothetical protein [Arsenophonus sp.]